MSKNNTKKNSIKTENPFELIQQILLISRSDKHLRVGIRGTQFECTGKNAFELKKFEVIKPTIDDNTDIDEAKVINRVKRFALVCKNPIEVITMIMDAYKLNKELFKVEIISRPTHRDAMDSRFIYNVLML